MSSSLQARRGLDVSFQDACAGNGNPSKPSEVTNFKNGVKCDRNNTKVSKMAARGTDARAEEPFEAILQELCEQLDAFPVSNSAMTEACQSLQRSLELQQRLRHSLRMMLIQRLLASRRAEAIQVYELGLQKRRIKQIGRAHV